MQLNELVGKCCYIELIEGGNKFIGLIFNKLGLLTFSGINTETGEPQTFSSSAIYNSTVCVLETPNNEDERIDYVEYLKKELWKTLNKCCYLEPKDRTGRYIGTIKKNSEDVNLMAPIVRFKGVNIVTGDYKILDRECIDDSTIWEIEPFKTVDEFHTTLNNLNK